MALLKNKLVLIIVAVLLLGGGSAYYFLFMGKKSVAEAKKKGHGGGKHADDEVHASEESGRDDEEAHESKKHKDEDDEDDEDEEEDEEEASSGGGHGGGHGEESKGPMIDPFVVNLADAGSRRYLRTSMKLELRKAAESEPLLTERMPQVRDAILVLLSGKMSDQLLTSEGKTALRTELITLLNKVLKKKKLKKPVKNLYFTEFLIQ